MRRWVETGVAGCMLALVATPFVGLFPEPPAFGQGAAGIAAAVAVLAMVGIAFRATQPKRRRILGWAAILLAITAGSIAARILLARTIEVEVPTLDMLPAIFGLQGEDIDDAILYEGWVELWLAVALATTLAFGLRRVARPRRPLHATVAASSCAAMVPTPMAPPWNVATVLLWLVGWGMLAGAVVDGHRTTAFLRRAVHVTGTIVDAQPHPSIRFTTADGTIVEYGQNGSVSRPLGAAVPVAYLAADPSGSARADTFWANWGDLLGLVWIGLGFTLFPFYGLRATFRAGRW